jgi:hypothetical protein
MINVICKSVTRDLETINKIQATEFMDKGAIITVKGRTNRRVFACVKLSTRYVGTEDTAIEGCEQSFDSMYKCIRKSRTTSTLQGWWDYYFNSPSSSLTYTIIYPQGLNVTTLSIPTLKVI